jgi:hypothetical protein
VKAKCEKLEKTLTDTKCRCRITFFTEDSVLTFMENAKLDDTEQQPLSKFFKNKFYAKVNCKRDRPFEIQYTYTKEMVIVSFYYGLWNAVGVPQHV